MKTSSKPLKKFNYHKEWLKTKFLVDKIYKDKNNNWN